MVRGALADIDQEKFNCLKNGYFLVHRGIPYCMQHLLLQTLGKCWNMFINEPPTKIAYI